MRVPIRTFLFPVISLLFAVTASSQADETLFSKSSQTLERLWSGVLGCHDAGDTQGFIPLDRYNSGDGIGTGTGSTSALNDAGRRDYSECARQSLRNTASRMLVDTIEDAVRSGGIALFEDRFRLDSSISWVLDESVHGEIDAVFPVWGEEYGDGTGSALFMQPGVVIWNGLEGAERVDANFGLVLRTHLDKDTAVGGSLFFDYDFRRGHRRLGVGVDAQSGVLQANVNYYHPLSDWRKGREGFEEQALQGADFRLGLALDRVRLDGSLGVWRFEGEREQARRDWHTSHQFTGEYRVFPGVFLQGGYEHHNTDDSLGSRWNAGLAFRFSLPGFEGSDSGGGRVAVPDLWRLVEREKRVLYEERFDIIPAVARIETSIATLAEGDDPFTMRFDFDKPLEREVTVVFAATARSSADAGDYALSGAATVTPPTISGTSQGVRGQGEQGQGVVAVGAQTNGEGGRLEMVLPQYTSSMTLTITITNDDISETDEIIELAATTTGANSRYARLDGLVRITIPRNDDYTIGFASPSSRVDEGAGAVTTHLLLRLGRPAPAGGVPISVSASGQTSDITFTSPTTVTVPAGTDEGVVAQSVASVAVTVNADTIGERAEEVVFTIARGSPFPQSPWRLDPGATTHTLTINANDNTVGFAASGGGVNPSEYDETDGVVTRTVQITGVAAPAGGLPFRWAAAGDGTTNISRDISPTGGSFTIPAGQTSATFDFNIVNDEIAEAAETVRLILEEGVNFPDGWSIPSPNNEFSINASDNTIQFARGSSTLEETNTGGIIIPLNVNLPHAAGDIQVGLGISGSAGSGEYSIDVPGAGSYSSGAGTLTIPGGTGTVNIRVRSQGVDNQPESDETIILTLSERPSPNGFPNGWGFGTRTVHTITIPENEEPRGSVGFASSNTTSASEGQRVTLAVASTATANARLPLNWSVTTGASDVDGSGSGTVTVNSGSSRATFSFTIADPPTPDPEGPENVVVTLTGPNLPTGWSLGTRTHTINIPANDRRITFAATTATVLESAGHYDLTLSLNDASTVALPIRITAPSGITVTSPDVPGNWNAGSATYTIPANSGRSAKVRLAFPQDSTYDDNSYGVTFREGGGFPSSAGWELAGTSFTLEVDDPEPNTVQFAPSSGSVNRTGGSEGETVTLTVRSSTTATADLDLTWEVNDDADNSDDDIATDDGTVTIQNGSNSETFDIVIRQDNVAEPAEDVTVTLGSRLPTGWKLGNRTTHTITIAADDNTIKFASASGTVGEGDGTYNAEVQVNAPNPDSSIRLNITTGGGATRGSDYTVGSSVTVPVNGRTVNIPVTIIDDSVFGESGETIELTITGPPDGWALVSPTTHVITITDNDSAPSGTFGFAASGNAATASEGDTVSLTVRSTAAPAAGSPISFNWSVSPSGEVATSSGSGTITAPATSETFDIEIVNDTVAETADEITVTLTDGNASDNFTLNSGTATHTITIAAEDNTIDFSSNTGTIAEQNTTSFNITLRINQPLPAGTVASVDLTPSGTAASNDYTRSPASGNNGSISGDTWTLPTGTGTATLEITAVADGVDEADPERVTFTLENLTGATGWSLGSATTQHVDISDADSTPSGTFGFAASGNAATASEGDTVSLTVRSSAAPAAGSPISFNWSVSPSGEVATSSGSGTITAPATSETFDIEIVNDTVAETADEITVTLTDGNTSDDFTLNNSAATHIITIAAEDNTVAFTSSTGSIAEQNTTSFNITLGINQPLPAGTVASVDLTP
ncbi:MAG: inverse autotransporter beta domain-containing protein, partial [Hyphomicrobiales bacterium]|nr:inverse autotransporter beta domain-containing protein [Hyphomicrobiales bacterium]